MISLLQFFYVYAQDETAKHNQIVLGAVLFVIACPLEMFRFYLGYSGNLRENVRLIPYKFHMFCQTCLAPLSYNNNKKNSYDYPVVINEVLQLTICLSFFTDC